MILGIDEVGRGPWAGPLVIGAVILPEDKPAWVAELNDSKKLSAKKREELNEIILKEAPATGLGWVSSAELDEVGLSAALCLAARRAVKEVQKAHVPFTEIIIDGTQNFLRGTALENHVSILKKADFLIKEVSAASIIAKVARDRYMCDLAKKYPEYGFEKHVGYGTAAHKQALQNFGPCPEHRVSFRPIAEIVKEKNPLPCKIARTKLSGEGSSPNATTIGKHAEDIVAHFLESDGHAIIARNHKTKFYEIDIVSAKGNKLYFTEVKYRKSQYRGTSFEQITPEKLKQMRFAAENFIKFRKDLKDFSPLLAAASVSGADFHLDDWFEIV